MSIQPDWKPSARERATRNQWEGLRAEKLNGPCRGCGGAPEHLHHLVNRSQGGDDVADNLIPLCHVCHEAYHHMNPQGEAIAMNVRASLTGAEVAYVTAKKGRWWMEGYYPSPQDGELCAKCKRPRKAKAALEPRRPRKRWQITVPADAEDGADVLDGLIDGARAELAEPLGYTDDTPAYFVLTAVLASFLQSERQAA